jgi:formate hydrogenlyase transcriptional activator
VKAATRVLVRANGRTLKGAVTLSVRSTLATPPLQDRQSVNIEEALVQAARALTSHLDVDGVCAAVLDAVENVFGARSSWILLFDPGIKQLRTVCARGLGSNAFRDLKMPPDAGILGMAFTRRTVIFVHDAKADDRWYDASRVHEAPLQSVFAVPLMSANEALGVVGLDSPDFDADHPPGEADIARLEALAAQAAIAIANARLYSASEEDRRRLRSLLQEQKRLRDHVTHLEEHVRVTGVFREIVGQSAALKETVEQAALAAPGDTTILLLGETGSGKELLARFIHERSSRSRGPFVPVNCAALPEALVESELFGHEKGAFTGAIARKPGKFEIAHRGTVFLDEIGDLPKEAQAKLLRVLQDRHVQRVGSTQSVEVDVRVVAATNQNLEEAIGTRQFRPDLYYRLSVFPVRLPPLRERRDDIPELARYFMRHFSSRLRRHLDRVTPAALDRLRAYDWPGNIRELQNVMERAVILSKGTAVDVDAIQIASVTAEPHRVRHAPGVSGVTLAEAERRAILAALEGAHWRVSGSGGAADRLAVKPTTLHAKMKKLGIRRPADDFATQNEDAGRHARIDP